MLDCEKLFAAVLKGKAVVVAGDPMLMVESSEGGSSVLSWVGAGGVAELASDC